MRVADPMNDGQLDVTADLVRRLVDDQLPGAYP